MEFADTNYDMVAEDNMQVLLDCEDESETLLDDWVYVARIIDPETGELETDEVFDARKEAEF